MELYCVWYGFGYIGCVDDEGSCIIGNEWVVGVFEWIGYIWIFVGDGVVEIEIEIFVYVGIGIDYVVFVIFGCDYC